MQFDGYSQKSKYYRERSILVICENNNIIWEIVTVFLGLFYISEQVQIVQFNIMPMPDQMAGNIEFTLIYV